MKKILTIAVALFTLSSASAQTISELFKFSNYDYTTSTARSAGMAGAYTSLGSDMSSMSINPAGLAMYTSSESGFTMGVNSAGAETNYGGNNSQKNWNTNFSLPNIGWVFNNGDVTFGVAFNRLANLSRSSSAVGNYEQFNTKGRIWADQLEGITAGSLNNDYTLFNGQSPVTWDAIMAYDSYCVDPLNDKDNCSTYGLWGIVDPADYIASQIQTVTEGAVNELVFSLGYNFDDMLYFGMSLGFQYIYYTERSVYEEFNDIDSNVGIFDNLYLADRLWVDGYGFDMKFGVTARPLPWLRIGVAYHTPTWMSIDEISSSDMQPYFTAGTGRYSWSPDLYQDYTMRSPNRILTGVSATLFGKLIVSVDYDRVWYNDMKYSTNINLSGWREGTISTDIENLPNYAAYTSAYGNIDLNAMISDYYRPVNNYRVGLEVQPIRALFLRAGFAYSDSPYADVSSFYDSSSLMSDYGSTTRYTAGIGYRTGRFNIDFAYTYASYTSLPSKFFDYVTTSAYDSGYDVYSEGTSIASFENIYTTNINHNFLLSMNWRF